MPTGIKAINTSRVSNTYGAFYYIKASDFGDIAPGTNNGEGTFVNGNLAYNAGAGSLAMTTAYVKITYITLQGESLPSAEASVSVSASSGAVTVTVPTTPPANVIGWRVYSASTTASEKLQTAANSTTQVQQNFVTTAGTLAGFAIATTAVQILIYGTGAVVPAIGASGIQPALPSVSANTTVDIFLIVAHLSAATGKSQYIRPFSAPDPAGVSARADGRDCADLGGFDRHQRLQREPRWRKQLPGSQWGAFRLHHGGDHRPRPCRRSPTPSMQPPPTEPQSGPASGTGDWSECAGRIPRRRRGSRWRRITR